MSEAETMRVLCVFAGGDTRVVDALPGAMQIRIDTNHETVRVVHMLKVRRLCPGHEDKDQRVALLATEQEVNGMEDSRTLALLNEARRRGCVDHQMSKWRQGS